MTFDWLLVVVMNVTAADNPTVLTVYPATERKACEVAAEQLHAKLPGVWATCIPGPVPYER